ncbi:hypothetical protein RKD28_002772 [Streptomyces sp. SAI-229]
MSLYAAYAAHLDARLMSRRAPHSPLRATGWLNEWRLTFGGEHLGGEGALATLVEDPISAVFVALYDIAPMDEEPLDRWEGAGDLDLYRRTRVRVHTLDGEEPRLDVRPQRLRGRPPRGPLPGRDRRRGGVRGRTPRLCDGAPQAPLLTVPSQ